MDKGLYYYYGNEIIYSDDPTQNQEYNVCYECVPGFIYISKSNTCVECPTGCLDCNLKADGITTYCKECAVGYALNENLGCTVCANEIQNCLKCYRSFSDWYNISYNAIYDNDYMMMNPEIVYTNLVDYYLNWWADFYTYVQTLCISCKEEYTPSLSLKTCKSCATDVGTGCKQCNYLNTYNYFRDMNYIYAMYDSDTSFSLVCQLCEYPKFIREDGETCSACTITNCEKCYWGESKTDELTFPNLYTYNWDWLWPLQSTSRT